VRICPRPDADAYSSSVRLHSRVSSVLRLPTSIYRISPQPRDPSHALRIYYRFRLLAEWNDVQHILALPGTEVVSNWLSNVCREPRTPDNYLFLDCFSSHSAEATVRNRLRDNDAFFVIIFCGSEHTRRPRAIYSHGPERRLGMTHTSLLTVWGRAEGYRICNNLVMDVVILS